MLPSKVGLTPPNPVGEPIGQPAPAPLLLPPPNPAGSVGGAAPFSFVLQELPDDLHPPAPADGDPLPRQLKVNGLPLAWTLVDLQRYFVAYGQVDSVYFGTRKNQRRPHDPNFNPGFGFVYYARGESAIAAILGTRRAPPVQDFWVEYCRPQRSRFKPSDPRHPNNQAGQPGGSAARVASKVTAPRPVAMLAPATIDEA